MAIRPKRIAGRNQLAVDNFMDDKGLGEESRLPGERSMRLHTGLGRFQLIAAHLLVTLAFQPAHAQLGRKLFQTRQTQPQPQKNLSEPIYRVAKNNRPVTDRHPLDSALQIAQAGLQKMRTQVADYTCVLVKRERINGRMGSPEYIYAKIRNQRVVDGKQQPFSVYMYFLKPSKGREVIYVDGMNNNRLRAHEGGIGAHLLQISLDPKSSMAMKGQRYPLTEVGIENLIIKLLEKGNRDRKRNECTVTFRKGANVNKRKCTVLEVKHPVRRPYFDFHIARVYIDDELKLPIRYAAFSWPKTPGGEPVLEEEYTYLNLKLNAGLADTDFDYRNPNYNFVRSKRRR